MDTILLLSPSMTCTEDSYTWLLNKFGSYSSKSRYISWTLYPASELWIPPSQMDWSAQTLPKIQLFLWKVIDLFLQEKIYSTEVCWPIQRASNVENQNLPYTSYSSVVFLSKSGIWFLVLLRSTLFSYLLLSDPIIFSLKD